MRHKITAIIGAFFLFAWWVIWPATQYNLGTSENVSVEVLAEPFLGGDRLVYRWSGDVVRSCPVELRRTITDSENVITNLTSRDFGKLPASSLGFSSYEIETSVPIRIAEGPAVYQVVEVPRCNWMQFVFPVEVPYPPVNFMVTR